MNIYTRSTILCALVLLFNISYVYGYTCTGTNCIATLSYIEPTTYVGGLPITNLQDGLFTYQLDGGANQTLTVPASKPAGGGAISSPIAAQLVPACTAKTLTGSLVMRTTVGGVSAPTLILPLIVDRTKLANGSPDPACTTPNPGTNPNLQ